MAVDEAGSGVTDLPANACWALLRSQEVGRLAVSIADRPEIFPVNYVVDHGTVVFRTAEGTKLAGAVAARRRLRGRRVRARDGRGVERRRERSRGGGLARARAP